MLKGVTVSIYNGSLEAPKVKASTQCSDIQRWGGCCTIKALASQQSSLLIHSQLNCIARWQKIQEVRSSWRRRCSQRLHLVPSALFPVFLPLSLSLCPDHVVSTFLACVPPSRHQVLFCHQLWKADTMWFPERRLHKLSNGAQVQTQAPLLWNLHPCVQ